MAEFEKTDAQRLTGAGGKETARAYHQADDDSGVRENPDVDFHSPTSWGQTKEDAHPDNRENYGKDKK